jgi:hypothetical protein
VVRWHEEQIELPEHIDSQGLLRLMRDRSHAIAETMAGRQVLVKWVLTDGDQMSDSASDVLAARLRQSNLSGELLQSMRNEFGMDVPGLWSISLAAEAPAVLPSGWYEEDTVLGDLLRCVQHFQNDESTELGLEPPPANGALDMKVVSALARVERSERQRLLRQVAILGVDVLRGDRVLSE